jgi:FG-GAP-like repeat
MRGWWAAIIAGIGIVAGAQHAAPAHGAHGRAPVRMRIADGIPVSDSEGRPMMAPWLGGFDVPRPQLVDIRGNGTPDLFVQEWSGRIIYFERVGDQWVWRSDKYQDLDVGEWFRFVDVDADGRIDLLAEMPQGYIRLFKNVGTKTEAKFTAIPDTIRDVDGLAILADRQNILNAVDIDCNGRLDLFIGRVQGTVDRFEQDGVSPAGAPRFRLHTPNWEGIEILGPEATGGSAVSRPISDTGLENREDDAGHGTRDAGPLFPESRVPRPASSGSARHGANTLTFADVSGKGTLDLFWGDFFEAGLLQIENTGTCAQPFLQNKPVEFPQAHPVITSGYNAPTFGDVNHDGIVDLIMGVIGGAYGPARTSIDNLYLLTQAPKGNWAVKSKRLISQIDVGSDAIPVLADLRGTGTLDLLIGSKISPSDPSTGTITWFENVGTKTAPAFHERGILPFRGQFNYAPAIVDLDGDGLPDIVVGTWRDKLQWHRNTGTRTDPKWTLFDTALVTIPRGSNTVPAFADIDGDGLIDLIIGTASGRMLLYKNVGTKSTPKFEMVTASFQDIKFGRRVVPTFVDMDKDGKPDLLIGNEAGEMQLWRNVGKGAGEFRMELDPSFVMKSYPGAAPTAGDLHGTGKLDILVGTSAGGVRLMDRR